MQPTKIISGGQTGVDQAALRVAKQLGIDSGGYMPQGWRTQEGPRPEFRECYGMIEHASPDYSVRTQRNVEIADGTLILGDVTSPGSSITLRLCTELRKPVLVIPRDRAPAIAQQQIRAWISEQRIATLNVAGNREELNPGIGNWAERLLLATFGQLPSAYDR